MARRVSSNSSSTLMGESLAFARNRRPSAAAPLPPEGNDGLEAYYSFRAAPDFPDGTRVTLPISPSNVGQGIQPGGGDGLGGGVALAGAAGAGVGGGWAVLGDGLPAATIAIRSTSIRYRGMPTNSIRPLTRIAGPNCNLCFARVALLSAGDRTSAVHSGWSARRRSAISRVRSSWNSCREDKNVTVTIPSRRTRGAHIKFVRTRRKDP